VLHKYVASLYWSYSTITTVGYGDLVPTSTLERAVAIISMVIGVTVFGYFMGNMTSMVGAMNDAQQEHDKRMETIQKFLRFRDIPSGLADRVISYYQFLWGRELQQEEQRWLNGLNPVLKTEMVLYLYQDAINRVPFFNGKNPHFIAAMVQYLQPETYSPSDVISRQGEPATCMYFVSRGAVFVCLQVPDDLAQDVLSGSKVLKFDGDAGAGEPTLEQSIDLAKLRRQGSFEPGPQAANTTFSSHSHTSLAATEADQEELDARRKVLATMQSAHRQARAVPIAGGMRRRGAFQEEDSDDEQEQDEDRQVNESEQNEVIYMIPDDVLEIKAAKRPEDKRRSAHSNHSSGNQGDEIESMSSELHEKFAMSRRATRVHTDLEMIEAVAVMGSGAQAYRRVGTLKSGTYFGEYSCLLGLQRTITVVAVTTVEVFALTRNALETVLTDWPDIADDFRSMVKSSPMGAPENGADVQSRQSSWNILHAKQRAVKDIVGLSRATSSGIADESEVSREALGANARLQSKTLDGIPASAPDNDSAVKNSMENFSGSTALANRTRVGPMGRWLDHTTPEPSSGGDTLGPGNVSRVEALRDRRKSMHVQGVKLNNYLDLAASDSLLVDDVAPSEQSITREGSARRVTTIMPAPGTLTPKTRPAQ